MRGGDGGRYRRNGLIAPIVGHAGDGNFHVLALMDSEDAGEVAQVERFVAARLNMRAIAMEGTCTGEHGIGQGKVDSSRPSMAINGVEVMRQDQARSIRTTS